MFLLSEFTPQPVMRQHELNSTLAPGVALQSGINENGAHGKNSKNSRIS